MQIVSPTGSYFILSEGAAVSFWAFGSEGVRGQARLHDRPHHVAFVGKTNTLSIYVDKILLASGSIPASLAGTNGARAYIGGNADFGYHGFNGVIDRVRIAREALSPEGFFPHRRRSGLILEGLVPETVEVGKRAVLRVVADSSSGPLTYEWTFNETPIAGANSDTLILDPIEHSHDGLYSVRVSNGQGKSNSSSALVAVWGMPRIRTPPLSQTVSLGAAAWFSVEVENDRLLTYSWRFNGVEIPGENGPTLLLPAVQASQAGRYAVHSHTPRGTFVTPDAILTVLGADTIPPVITINSPAPGTAQEDRVTVEATISDDIALGSITLERNGEVLTSFPLSVQGYRFLFRDVILVVGTNAFTIRATDHAGNGSTNEVVVLSQPSRILSLPVDATVQEGEYITMPIMFQSNGEVGAIDFTVSYWSNRLSAPKVTWLLDKEGARGEVDSGRWLGSFSASFSLAAGDTFPAGNILLAYAHFKTLSLPEPLFVRFLPRITGIHSISGEPFLTGNAAFGGTITITLREITADNNANGRLDIGDASAVERRIAGLDTLEPYDITGNDLNGDNTLDTEDTMRVLRVVVDIDSQPPVPGASAILSESLTAFAVAGPSVRLAADSQEIRPGQKLKVSVLLDGNDTPLEGAAFKLEYPISALRLDDAQSHQIGPIVPPNVNVLWNLAPSQDNYATQNGAVYFAACSAAPWAERNGMLAEFAFTVQSAVSSQLDWPVRVSRVELSHDSDLEILSSHQISLAARQPVPARLSVGAYDQNTGTFRIAFTGEIGFRYRIDRTDDLETWTEAQTIVATDNEFIVTDANAGQSAHRYYRAVQID
jgi:hypothetical protein